MALRFANVPALLCNTKEIIGYQWSHSKRLNGTLVVVLNPDFLALQYGLGDYTSLAEFLDEFRFIFDAFRATTPVDHTNRIGLRYINEIKLDDGGPLDWDSIIDDRLVPTVTVGMTRRNDERILRSMHQVITLVGDVQIVTNYGLVNQDFPNPVARREFVLDIDCSCAERQAMNDVEGKIVAMNSLAAEVFEKSIGDGLRDKLGVIDGN